MNNATHEDPVIITRDVMNAAQFEVHISANAKHPGFTFKVDGDKITVEALKKLPASNKTASDDWRTALSPYEKVNVMNVILSIYRVHSQDEFKVAAVGVTDTGKMRISVNEHITPNSLTRLCAELGVGMQSQKQETLDAAKEGRARREVKLSEVYMQGGGPGVTMAAPCGNCTDYLSKMMRPDGKIYVIPTTESNVMIALDDKARSVQKVQPGRAWATTIGYLNRNREMRVKPDYLHLLTDGIAELKATVRKWLDVPDGEDPNTAIYAMYWPNDTSAIAKYTDRQPAIDYAKLNAFMVRQINIVAADRTKARATAMGYDVNKLSDEALGDLFENELKWVRCSVARRDDGKLFVNTTARVQGEKGISAAEQNAFVQGMSKLGTLGIRDMWVMEMSPKDARHGVMRTSAKGAVERLLKWASKETGTVDFHYLPWNDGKLTADRVIDAMVNKDAEGIYPSAHVGAVVSGPASDEIQINLPLGDGISYRR